jgi:hypothetical protein
MVNSLYLSSSACDRGKYFAKNQKSSGPCFSDTYNSTNTVLAILPYFDYFSSTNSTILLLIWIICCSILYISSKFQGMKKCLFFRNFTKTFIFLETLPARVRQLFAKYLPLAYDQIVGTHPLSPSVGQYIGYFSRTGNNRGLMYVGKQRLWPYNSNLGLNNSNLNSK